MYVEKNQGNGKNFKGFLPMYNENEIFDIFTQNKKSNHSAGSAEDAPVKMEAMSGWSR